MADTPNTDCRTFTCSMCGGTFHDEWTQEEAQAEYDAHFPNEEGGKASACDDCYQQVMEWARANGMIEDQSA